MNTDQNRNIIYLVLPLTGIVFCLWYVKSATCDVVYSDYIRLVNSYLPDVYNPEKFFVPDVLTRIPVNYLCRIINVEFFGFSVTLERVLGVVSLGLAGWVFAAYCRLRRIGCLWFALLTGVMFSLNKWEMLTNGSGWSHFLAFACFYYHELVLDRVWTGEEKRYDRLKLLLLPWFIILGTAGPYCAVYAATLLLSYGFCMVISRLGQGGSGIEGQGGSGIEGQGGSGIGGQGGSGIGGRGGSGIWDLRYLAYMACALIPLLLYMLSNSFAVEEHAGATGRSLGVILSENPTFPVRFLLKSFAGILVGGEELKRFMEAGMISNGICYALGLFVVSGYALALWLNFRFRLYQRTVMPLMLLAGGGMNHVIIFISRYIFEKEEYALSSRYALQFQVGILGIILTFAFVWGIRERAVRGYRCAMALFCLAILMGNGYTTYRELQKAPSREERFEEKALLAREVPFMSEEELEEKAAELGDAFEFHKGVDRIQSAFQILEENNLNLFRQ